MLQGETVVRKNCLLRITSFEVIKIMDWTYLWVGSTTVVVDFPIWTSQASNPETFHMDHCARCHHQLTIVALGYLEINQESLFPGVMKQI